MKNMHHPYKYWFEVSEKEQHKRFLKRIEDPMRRWKFKPDGPRIASPLVRYSRARDAMLRLRTLNNPPGM